MCDPVTMGVVAAGATVMQGYQAYQQGKFEEGVANYNARQTENEATMTRNKGVEQENKQRRATAELISKQKAQSAASGVDVNTGSAVQLRDDSALLGELDALTIRENFENQAQSFDDQASLTRQQGKNAKRAGRNALLTSLGTAPLSFVTTKSAFGGASASGGGGQLVKSSWYNNNSALNQSTSLSSGFV